MIFRNLQKTNVDPIWADIQGEETVLLLDMHMMRNLQSVNWKYLDSQPYK